jgi:predicted tellurium resistance membrane protein TerC
MPELFSTESLISFIILVILEIVLGIDNVIFVSIIINKLKESDRKRARRVWMVTGILIRSMLLFGLSWLLSQRGKPLFTLFNKGFDLASLVMIIGGLFLIYKSVKEIHGKLEGEDPDAAMSGKPRHISFGQAIVQLMVIDMVFSFDSVITAGGTAKFLEIMIAAVIIAMIVMFLFSPKIASFIHKHPTLKMLALSFLVMIGLSLVIEGWDHHKAEELRLKNYIYFGMAFSFLVELLNMTMMKRNKKRRIVELNEPVLRTNEEEYSDSAH